jgi:hypothetical protein
MTATAVTLQAGQSLADANSSLIVLITVAYAYLPFAGASVTLA